MSETQVATLSPQALSDLLAAKAGPAPMVLDVVVPEHWEAARIPGSVSACVFEVIFPETVAKLVPGKTTPLVVYDPGGGEAAQVAAHRLAHLGYESVSILEGGLAAWHGLGLPLEGPAQEPPAKPPVDPRIDFLPKSGRYEVEPKNSGVYWSGRNHNHTHHGSVRLEQGWLSVSHGVLTGEFSLDMTGLEDFDLTDMDLRQLLIRHLMSDDFFDVARHPTARFVIEKGMAIPKAPPGAANFDITGSATIRGVTAGLCFPATLVLGDDGSLACEAHFDLDRTLFGARYGSGRIFQFLGYHLVFDPVSIAVRLKATRRSD